MIATLSAESMVRAFRLRAATILGSIAAIQLGCAAASRPIPLRQANLPYPVGVWYRAGAVTAELAGSVETDFETDLATCARLGANTLFMCDPRDDAWHTAASAARSHGLEPLKVVGAAEMTRAGGKVVTGYAVNGVPIELSFETPPDEEPADPPGESQVSESVGPPADIAKSPSAAAEIPSGAGDSQASTGAEPSRPILHFICDRAPGEEAVATVARWWKRFHVGLAQGLTGGLAFDRVPGVEGGISAAEGGNATVTVEYAAALKGIAARMRAWGPMLDRLALRPAPILAEPVEGLQIALFARDRRRLLLLVNRSADRVLRSTLTLPDRIDGQTASRLVQVPAGPGLELGTVVRAARGMFNLPVEIGPGEAMLFEAFDPVSDNPRNGGI